MLFGGQKCAFFLLSVLFFHENTTIWKVLGTKNYISFEVCYSVVISWGKNFPAFLLLGIKFTPIWTAVHMYL